MVVGPNTSMDMIRDAVGLTNRADLHKKLKTNKLNSEVRWSEVARIKTDRDMVSPPYRGRTKDREMVPAYNIINPIITGLRGRKTNPQTLPASGSKGRRTAGGGGTTGHGGGGAHLT